jgi:uncharacterized RDD family membrane protein YckC
MNWHYVNQGQQAGPVTEEELLALVRERKVSEETLVWQEGMPNWTAFHEAGIPTPSVPPRPAAVQPPAPLNPNEAACGECGQIFPLDETIAHGPMRVCAGCKPVFLQKLAEGAKVNSGALNYATFEIRCGAKLIDGAIAASVYIGILVVLILVMSLITRRPSYLAGTPVFAMFMGLFFFFGGPLIFLGYEIYFLSRHGATPGKMVCRLKVVAANGSPIGYTTATARAFAEWLSRISLCLGYLMVLVDNEQRRALHDHICNTRVVYK